jgi:hypothetical protein
MLKMLFVTLFSTILLFNAHAALPSSGSKIHGHWQIDSIYSNAKWKVCKQKVILKFDYQHRTIEIGMGDLFLKYSAFMSQRKDFQEKFSNLLSQLLELNTAHNLYYNYIADDAFNEYVEIFYHDSTFKNVLVAKAKRCRAINPFVVQRALYITDLSSASDSTIYKVYAFKKVMLHALNYDRRFNTFSLSFESDSLHELDDLLIQLDEDTRTVTIESYGNKYNYANEITHTKKPSYLARHLYKATRFVWYKVDTQFIDLYSKDGFICTIRWD